MRNSIIKPTFSLNMPNCFKRNNNKGESAINDNIEPLVLN